jgi:hypothetical protein
MHFNFLKNEGQNFEEHTNLTARHVNLRHGKFKEWNLSRT